MPMWKAEKLDQVILQPWCVVKALGNKLFLVGEQANGMDGGSGRLSTMIKEMDYGEDEEGNFNNKLMFTTMSGRHYECRGEPRVNGPIDYMLGMFRKGGQDYEVILEQEFLEDIIGSAEYKKEFEEFRQEIGK